MLRQENLVEKSENYFCDNLARVAAVIEEAESKIDPDDDIYLMTWSPDPKKLPDCDFFSQHRWCVEYVRTYLSGCKSGCACVESTQRGNPHYHFWYQTHDNPLVERHRITWIKILQKIGNIKIADKTVQYYRINAWFKDKNALFYYKEDACAQQLFTPNTPVHKYSPLTEIDYEDYKFFFTFTGKKTAREFLERTSQVKDLSTFYGKSL
uniref:Uncharacterized protein n=1 Tax=Antarctic circular DNA molecule TaxID=2664238 RepID=A0A5Q2EYT4_9ZZZZ|nr:hypothetical protein [Antarctic circular DNA molecule]